MGFIPSNYVIQYCEVEIHRSARKHGIDDAAILHTLNHAITVIDLDPGADPPKVFAIGPDHPGGHAMTEPKTHRTRSGRTLTDKEIDALSNEVAETDYNVEALKTRRRGRPPMGSGPADVVPVRIDPELRAAIEARAEAEHTTTSEIIREAIRQFLEVA